MSSPLIPMGAVTGKPDAERMRQLLNAYRSVGIDNFLLYPRSGLEIEYMSEEWLALCEDTVRIAGETGMKIWLYDEYNWPSGNCRGQVTQGHPEFYPHAVTFTRAGDAVSVRVVQNRVGADILNPDAVARFLALTHQRYFDRFGSLFGTVVQGIYTDEPSFSYFTQGLAPEGEGTAAGDFLALPWYGGMEEEYAAAYGRDFREDVSASLLGNPREGLWEDVYTLLGERMRTVFIGAMEDWCREHGIVLTGHLMEEDAPNSVFFNGNPLKMLSRFSLPGLDDITTHLTLDYDKTAATTRPTDHLQLSALSLCQYASRDKAGALAELFALGPADLPLSHMRQMIWTCACFGVDHYVLAVAAADARGNWEKDAYYFPTSPTAPWFDCSRELGKDAEDAARTARKPYAPSVRLRFPSRLFMRLGRESASPLRILFRSLLEALVRFQVQYLYLDEEEETSLPVLAMDRDGLFIEGEEERFRNADAFAAHVRATLPQDLSVSVEDGAECRDLLVRRWADGTVTVVSLREQEEDRILLVRLADASARIRLPAHGVWTGRPEEAVHPVPAGMQEAVSFGSAGYLLSGANFLRCPLPKADPCFRFSVQEPLSGIRILARTNVHPVSVSLDGALLSFPEPAGDLPDGFRQLYSASLPLSLAKGEHILRAESGEPDSRFLPSALLQGFFETAPDGALKPFSGEAGIGPLTGIPGYTGSYFLNLDETEIPAASRLILCLDPGLSPCELFVDGVSLGRRCWPPYEWEIPPALQGQTADITLVLTTSILPLFGNTAPLDAEKPYPYWVKVRGGKYQTCGLLSVPVWKKAP